MHQTHHNVKGWDITISVTMTGHPRGLLQAHRTWTYLEEDPSYCIPILNPSKIAILNLYATSEKGTRKIVHDLFVPCLDLALARGEDPTELFL